MNAGSSDHSESDGREIGDLENESGDHGGFPGRNGWKNDSSAKTIENGEAFCKSRSKEGPKPPKKQESKRRRRPANNFRENKNWPGTEE